MKTIPLNNSIEEIIGLLIEWTELLEFAVFTYEVSGHTREEAEKEFGSTDYKNIIGDIYYFDIPFNG